MRAVRATLEWREIIWPRPLGREAGLAMLQSAADDPTAPTIALEVRGRGGRVRHLLGANRGEHALGLLEVPSIAADADKLRQPVRAARDLKLSGTDSVLNVTNPEESARMILLGLSPADRRDEERVLQMVLGPRLAATTARAKTEMAFSWPLLRFIEKPLDATIRKRREMKRALPGFRCVIRIGVRATTPARRRQLALSLLGGLKRLEAPGLRLGYQQLGPDAIGDGADVPIPCRWPLRLNAAEAAALLALPVGEMGYPGTDPVHPRPLPRLAGYGRPDADRALVALSTAGATLDQPLTRSTDALLRHLHVIGPTGTGKSVALMNLALQDMQAGRGVVVIEPKGDLINDLLARMPAEREPDLVVFNPLNDDGVIGLNPLAGSDSPELRADAMYGIFYDMFGDSLGVRTADILRSSLLTLARRPDASLIQLPLLLSDPRLRRRFAAPVMEDLALGPFWAWYENLNDGERDTVIAPLMNKLRALILSPVIRRVIGQGEPRFQPDDVFCAHRILLVPLPVNRLGEQGASLLGSLLISQLWDAARRRAEVAAASRAPVAVYLDEAQKFLHLGANIGDILATSRSYGVGWTLAHQYLAQLPAPLRSAILANCRSRIAFQLAREDAEALARTSDGALEAKDFTALPAYHIYASLYANGQAQTYMSGRTLAPTESTNNPDRLRKQSARLYGRSVTEVEAQFSCRQNTKEATAHGAESEQVGARRRRGHA